MKWISRKLFVLIAATFLFAIGKVDQDIWIWAVGIYLGIQGGVDAVAAWRNGGES